MAKATFEIQRDGQVMMTVEESGHPRTIVSREPIGMLLIPGAPLMATAQEVDGWINQEEQVKQQICQLLEAAFGAGEQTRAGEIRRLL